MALISLNNLERFFNNLKTYISNALSSKANTSHTHTKSEITDFPTIPTVNNATLTIQKNGTTVKTFTANASSNVTANITVPTKTSDLTNGSGFITSDNTKIPLAGSNQISGDLIPATDNSIDIGSSTKNIKMLYTKGITIDGTQFLPSDYVPRSGGAVMNGNILARNSNKAFLYLCGGADIDNSSAISIYGKDFSSYNLYGVIRIFVNNPNLSQLKQMYLKPDGTWTWDGSVIQYTSDQRLKQQISQIDDDLLTAWEDVELSQFKYNDAVDQKGDNARLHTGYVVQQIDKACKSHNVDISQYGLYCHEEYPEETREVENEDGTKETKVIRPASEHYSLRYTEALIVECAYLRKCIKELKEEIKELKNKD